MKTITLFILYDMLSFINCQKTYLKIYLIGVGTQYLETSKIERNILGTITKYYSEQYVGVNGVSKNSQHCLLCCLLEYLNGRHS